MRHVSRDWKPNGEALHELLEGAIDRSTGQDISGQVMSQNMIQMLMDQQRSDAIELLANHCKAVAASQSTLVRTQAPAKVFGDIHGQLRDLLLLFAR